MITIRAPKAGDVEPVENAAELPPNSGCPPPQALFPEAKQQRERRRRLRVVAVVFVLLLGGAIAGIAVRGILGGSSPTVSANEPQLVVPPGHIESLEWISTTPGHPVDGTENVFTTLGANAPVSSTQSLSYYSTASNKPTELQSFTVGAASFGRVPNPFVPATGRKVCWTVGPEAFLGSNTTAGQWLKDRKLNKTHCQTVSQAWVETPTGAAGDLPYRQSPAGPPVRTVDQRLQGLRDQLDPSYLFVELQKTAGSLTRLGNARLDGVKTTAYRGVLPSKAFWGIAAPFKAPIAEQVILASAQGKDWDYNRFIQRSVSFQIWVDHDGVVRRVVVDRIAKSDNSDEFDFTNFNRPIPQVPVSASEIFVLPEGAWNVSIGGNFGS